MATNPPGTKSGQSLFKIPSKPNLSIRPPVGASRGLEPAVMFIIKDQFSPDDWPTFGN
jgi:hypothetical protein